MPKGQVSIKSFAIGKVGKWELMANIDRKNGRYINEYVFQILAVPLKGETQKVFPQWKCPSIKFEIRTDYGYAVIAKCDTYDHFMAYKDDFLIRDKEIERISTEVQEIYKDHSNRDEGTMRLNSESLNKVHSLESEIKKISRKSDVIYPMVKNIFQSTVDLKDQIEERSKDLFTDA